MMRTVLALLLGLGLVASASAQTRVYGDPSFSRSRDWRSGMPEVLTVQSRDTDCTLAGTTAEIPFTLTGRGATVWLAVYTQDANPQYGGQPVGRGGPGNALLRAAGLDTMVYISSGEEFPEGSSVIRWDGADWTGHQVPAGTYQFFLFALDRQAKPTQCGGGFGPWGTTRIDTRRDPPEMWWPCNDGAPVLQLDGVTQTPGWAIHKSVMGTDFLHNPEGYQTFNIPWMNQILARNTDWKYVGGYELDTADPTVGYLLQFQYAPAGIWRVKYDAAAGTVLPDDTSWPNADRGFLAREPRTYNTAIANAFHHPWVPDDGRLYYSWTDRVDPKTPGIVILDRATGEIVEIMDYSDFYLVEYTDAAGAMRTYTPGPTGIDVDETGIYTSGFWMSSGPPNGMPWVDLPSFPLKRTYDGDILWHNGNGDGFVDRYQGAEAAARGINPVDQLVNVNCKVGRWGITIWSGYNNPQWGEIFGPDGAGLFKIMVDRMPPTLLGEVWWMDNHSNIDGLYMALSWGSPWGWYGTVHWPFDVTRGLLSVGSAAWSLGLTATNARGDSAALRFGLGQGCTAGLDAACGEFELPPLPPEGAFDARWQVAGTNGLQADYRDARLAEATWAMAVHAGVGGYPVTLSWDRGQLPAQGRLRLVDLETRGQRTNIDLRAVDGYTLIDGTIAELAVEYGTLSHTYDLPVGWSMVSLPCALPDSSRAAVFPPAISLFAFARGYQATPALAAGAGYWVNLPALAQVTVTGAPHRPSALQVALPSGWGMVGPGAAPLDVAGLRAAHRALVSVFGFANGYYAPTRMDPGKGYWVNLSSATTLDLSGAVVPAAKQTGASTAAAWTGPVLWAEGSSAQQALQLGVAPAEVVALPPSPPAGLFDARVEVDAGIDAWQVPAGSGPYRVRLQGGVDRLRWQVPAEAAWVLEINGVVVPLVGLGEVAVADGAEVWLRQGPVIPQATVLHGAYPNPFNPTTTIRYELAQAGEVRLRVYGVTGQLIRQLASGPQAAGSYGVTWDGRDEAGLVVGSGVYLCQLQAGDFRDVRRMVLLR